MSLAAFAVVYALGGFTFVPLLLAVVLVPALLLLPRIDETKAGGTVTDGGKKHDRVGQASSKEEQDTYTAVEGSAAADATFAVLRSYHFPSAVAALSARASALNGSTNAVSGVTTSTGGDTGDPASGGAESVYQSVYRTVLNRGKTGANSTASVLENDGAGGGGTEGGVGRTSRKAVVSANVFYIVLRHGHLMLYHSPAHLEVRHVISLAHHTISLTDGEQDVLPDADLFIKRTAIVLTPLPDLLPNGYPPRQQNAPPPSRPKPFYLFCSTCIEKEDFYHALLGTRASPPIPQTIAPEDLITLQSTLHSTSLTPETRAFNALVGRIFLAFHRTSFLEREIRTRIEKKIARVQKPTFIASLEVENINLGNSAPVLSQPRLKEINIAGDLTFSFDLRYAGGVQVGIAAVAKLDLGTRFKARSVDLVLSTSLRRLSGKMLVRIKPPPSNRIWFCFDSAPEMDIKVEPVVSSRQITYAFILRAIEERIRAVVAETLVKPNWDDVAFFDTRSQRVRGGIWSDEGASDDVEAEDQNTDTDAQGLSKMKEKSMSMPALSAARDAMDSAAGSSGSDTAVGNPSGSTNPALKEQVKRRSVASLPLRHAARTSRPEMAAPPPSTKPLRSPSFTSPPPSTPIVAVDGVSGVPVRSDDATLQAKKWHSRASAQTSNRREAVQAVREIRDRSMPTALSSERKQSTTPPDNEDVEMETVETPSRDSSEVPSSRPAFDTSSRTDSMRSTVSSIPSDSSRQSQKQRKTILAATAAATTAARNWGWNAIANRTGRGGGNAGGPRQPFLRSGAASSQASLSPVQPMGRGQPLPPPGTPLPGPQKKLFGGLGSGVGGKGSIKRKPVLPPRKPAAAQAGGGGVKGESMGGAADSAENMTRRSSEVITLGDSRSVLGQQDAQNEVEDDFGPWRENSGRESLTGSGEDILVSTDGRHYGATISSDQDADADVGTGEEAEPDSTDITPPSATPAEKKVPPPLPARRPPKLAIQPAVKPDIDSRFDDRAGPNEESGIPHLQNAADDAATQDHNHAPVLTEETLVSSPVTDEMSGSGEEDAVPSKLDVLTDPQAGEVKESLSADEDEPEVELETVEGLPGAQDVGVPSSHLFSKPDLEDGER